MLQLLLVAVEIVLPVEFVVDCSSCPPNGGMNSFTATFEDRTGRRGNVTVFLGTSTPASMSFALAGQLDNWGWSYERIDNRIVVVRGSKTAPVRSVTCVGQAWRPVVYPRFAERPWRPLAPPPREVKP
jgi:hypothetical protein